jgi:hypothetical protein
MNAYKQPIIIGNYYNLYALITLAVKKFVYPNYEFLRHLREVMFYYSGKPENLLVWGNLSSQHFLESVKICAVGSKY